MYSDSARGLLRHTRSLALLLALVSGAGTRAADVVLDTRNADNTGAEAKAWRRSRTTPERGTDAKGTATQRSLTDGLIFVGLAVLGELGFLAVCLIYCVLRPRQVRLGSDIQGQTLFRSFAIGSGAVAVVILFILIMQAVPAGLATLFWLPVLSALAYLLVAGFTMTAHQIGERLQANFGVPLGSSGRAVLSGGALLLLANLAPLVGQAVLLAAAVMALGVSLRCFFAKAGRQALATSPAEPPEPKALS